MTSLKELVIAAHGGQERWKAFERVTVDLQQGGALWSLKGQPHTLDVLEHRTRTPPKSKVRR